jgi:membrane protease YdiL (CAAX protease family)
VNRSGRLTSPGGEQAALRGTLLVAATLVVLNVVKHKLPSRGVPLSVVAALALLVFARWSGLSWDDLGLGADQAREGGVWGLAAALLISSAYTAGVLLPVTRGAFLDARYEMALPEALVTSLLAIPLGTVLLEEVAFRSVLWGMLGNHTTTSGVTVASSALFGLWHVLPSLDFANSGPALHDEGTDARLRSTLLVTLGTVAFTALGGVVAAELRRRSDSILASAGMHWATNGLGVLFGLVAWRLERSRRGSAAPVLTG